MFQLIDDRGVFQWYNTLSHEWQEDGLHVTEELLEEVAQADDIDDDSTVLVGMLADTVAREDMMTRHELWDVYKELVEQGWYEERYAREVLESIGVKVNRKGEA